MAGIVQIDVSGLIGKVLEHFGDEEKYRGGPPLYIIREVIDNPDTPVCTWMRNAGARSRANAEGGLDGSRPSGLLHESYRGSVARMERSAIRGRNRDRARRPPNGGL